MFEKVKGVEDVVIIGSGPAAVAAIVQFRYKNINPLVLDAGHVMPVSAVSIKDEMTATLNSRSNIEYPKDEEPYSVGMSPPTKKRFGSDYVLHQDNVIRLSQNGTDVGISLARGGMSNVWGASSMLFSPADMASWPVSRAEIYGQLESLSRFMTFSQDHGFSTDSEFTPESTQHRQSNQIYERLMDETLVFGSTKVVSIPSCLAVDVQRAPSELCKKCSACLRGCPMDAIFSSEVPLLDMIANGLDYRPNSTVIQLQESENGVMTTYIDQDGNRKHIQSRKVLVACGPVSSTALVLTALPDTDCAYLDECQALTLPVLSLKRIRRNGHGTTLADLFVEILDKASKKSLAHFQCYSPSDEIKIAAINSAKRFRLPSFVGNFISRRSLVAHGFVHPAASSKICINIERHDNHLKIHSRMISPNQTLDRRKIIWAFSRFLLRGRLFPLLPLVHWESVGRSYHLSGSFPMTHSKVPGNSSNTLGCPNTLKNIHILDATILPNVPPQSPTITVMCNSSRIAHTIAESMRIN
jgi:ferredoxin